MIVGHKTFKFFKGDDGAFVSIMDCGSITEGFLEFICFDTLQNLFVVYECIFKTVQNRTTKEVCWASNHHL